MKIDTNWQNYIQEYVPQDVDPFGAAYYITISFTIAVIPQDIYIFETLNPGSVVRILGRHNASNWKLLWEGPAQACPEESRKFHPPIRNLNGFINIIRLEFSKDHLQKHRTSIDAVLLKGYKLPECLLQMKNFFQSLVKLAIIKPSQEVHVDESSDLFSRLPDATILLMFQYLDLKSLSRCAQVNKTWYKIAQDPILFHNLSLKRYWYQVDGKTLTYFKNRCKQLKKLDLSWCDNQELYEALHGFLEGYDQLTHLSLRSVPLVEPRALEQISNYAEMTELRLTCSLTYRFECLSKLNKLITLDLSCTTISNMPLIQILKANPNLRHIIIDYCYCLRPMDWLSTPLSTYNQNLVVWSSSGVNFGRDTKFIESHFSTYADLEVLELALCLHKNMHTADFLQKIAVNCTNLRRLGISCWLHLDDKALLPVINCCKNLTHLNLSQNENITSGICDKALVSLPNLQVLNISYCPSIANERVRIWRQDYPHVTIQ